MASKIFLSLLFSLLSLTACAVQNLTATAGNQNAVNQSQPTIAADKSPVLVELFTSEG